MNSSGITLNKIFSFKEKDLSHKFLSEIESNEVKGIKWPVASNEIMKKMGDLLNISIMDIMVKAWNKYGFLRKYLNNKNYLPDETILVPLSKHTIKSEHHPYIEILIDERPVKKIMFNITVALTLKGIILKIQGGKIKEIQTGDCVGSGSITYKDTTILKKDFVSISLPGSVELRDGVPILS